LPDHGWEYAIFWTLRVGTERATLTREELLGDVERVEREEPRRNAELLFSLFRGYDLAGQPAKAFERLKELCDRYPHDEITARDGLRLGTAVIVNNPEFKPELGRLIAQVVDKAPANPGLRDVMNTILKTEPAIPLASIRKVATKWMEDLPDQMAPYYLLAQAIADRSAAPEQAREAETLVSTAIELSLKPHPFAFAEGARRQRAYELRSKLRAARGDLAGAIADARMAQAVAVDKIGADDLAMQAELWQQIGYGARAEALALDAFRSGSFEAEPLLKKIYTAQMGAETDFAGYLVARLRESGGAPLPALGMTPDFSAVTLDGKRIEKTSLTGGVTVLDFWFIGCPPCRAERPRLNDIVAEFGGKVRFVGLALDSDAALKAYQASTPLNYEIVPKSQDIATAFNVHSFPSHMVLDRAGRIVWMSSDTDDRIERLRTMIVRVLAGQTP
jgi:thiol-disulfide isomerase/thioredoxin